MFVAFPGKNATGTCAEIDKITEKIRLIDIALDCKQSNEKKENKLSISVYLVGIK